MKTLEQYILESKSRKGKSTWGKALNVIVGLEDGANSLNKDDFEEVQQDDFIWNLKTDDVATIDFLMDLYNKKKNDEVTWEYSPLDWGNYELTISDGTTKISMDLVDFDEKELSKL